MPRKAWPLFFIELSKKLKNQWPRLSVFQSCSPGLHPTINLPVLHFMTIVFDWSKGNEGTCLMEAAKLQEISKLEILLQASQGNLKLPEWPLLDRAEVRSSFITTTVWVSRSH